MKSLFAVLPLVLLLNLSFVKDAVMKKEPSCTVLTKDYSLYGGTIDEVDPPRKTIQNFKVGKAGQVFSQTHILYRLEKARERKEATRVDPLTGSWLLIVVSMAPKIVVWTLVLLVSWVNIRMTDKYLKVEELDRNSEKRGVANNKKTMSQFTGDDGNNDEEDNAQ